MKPTSINCYKLQYCSHIFSLCMCHVLFHLFYLCVYLLLLLLQHIYMLNVSTALWVSSFCSRSSITVATVTLERDTRVQTNFACPKKRLKCVGGGDWKQWKKKVLGCKNNIYNESSFLLLKLVFLNIIAERFFSSCRQTVKHQTTHVTMT